MTVPRASLRGGEVVGRGATSEDVAVGRLPGGRTARTRLIFVVPRKLELFFMEVSLRSPASPKLVGFFRWVRTRPVRPTGRQCGDAASAGECPLPGELRSAANGWRRGRYLRQRRRPAPAGAR